MKAAKINSNCVDCCYRGVVGVDVYCAYIFKVGKPRPCPPGDECTVKVGYKKRLYPQKKGKAKEDG